MCEHQWVKTEAMKTGKVTWYCLHCDETREESVTPISPEFKLEEKMNLFFADKDAGEKLIQKFEDIGYEFEKVKDHKRQIQKHFAQKELKTLKVDFNEKRESFKNQARHKKS